MSLTERLKKVKKFGKEFSSARIHVNQPKKTTTSTSTTTKKKKKKPLTKTAQMKADRAKRKADFEAHQQSIKAKGQGKMTLKERQADDLKRAKSAAAKTHDAFQKKHKRGKYSEKSKAKAKAAEDKKFGITDKDTAFSKFGKRGGLLGMANRGRKRLKKMTRDDLTIKFGKNKKK